MVKIMAVDDQTDIVSLLKRILESAGYAFVGCCSGEECLEKYAKEKPDLILLDIWMPGVDGWQVYERIRSINKAQKIAFLSALGIGPQSQVKLIKLGIRDYISKPFEPNELLERVREILARPPVQPL